MSGFMRGGELEVERHDWGTIAWRSTPTSGGSRRLVVLDVTLEAGQGHDFHRHPDQEEMIIVASGRVEQWIERRSAVLQPGDSALIDQGVVHASFNAGEEAARLQVVLSPALVDTPTGYALEDVAGQDPWASLREAPRRS